MKRPVPIRAVLNTPQRRRSVTTLLHFLCFDGQIQASRPLIPTAVIVRQPWILQEAEGEQQRGGGDAAVTIGHHALLRRESCRLRDLRQCLIRTKVPYFVNQRL